MEADLAFRGIDFRDYYRPRGGPSRLTLRRLGVLIRHLPMESHTAKAIGAHGFSMLELLVMETGIGPHGQLNPRHPFAEAERAQVKSRNQLLKDRQAYFAARSVGQDGDGEGESEGAEGEREQEPDLGAALAPAVDGPGDDARDVDAKRDGETPVHE